MKKDNNKQRWINDAMNSLEGIQKVDVDDLFFEKILGKLSRPEVAKTVKPLWPVMTAAAAVVVILINIATVYRYTEQKKPSNPEVYQTLKTEMNTLTDNNF